MSPSYSPQHTPMRRGGSERSNNTPIPVKQELHGQLNALANQGNDDSQMDWQNNNPLSCDICYLRFNKESRRPLVLTCGHTFCTSCLDKIKETKKISYLCPSCKCSYQNDDKHKLPANIHLLRVLSREDKQQQENEQSNAPRDSDNAINQDPFNNLPVDR